MQQLQRCYTRTNKITTYLLFLPLLYIWALPLYAANTQKLSFSTFPDIGLSLYTKPILIEAYRRIGIDIEIHSYPSERSLMVSNAGNVDGEVARLPVIEEQYTDLIRVPVSLGAVESTAFALDSSIVIDGWQSISDFSVVTVFGYKYFLEKTKNMQRTVLHSFSSVLMFLKNGRADVAILTEVDGLRAIKKLGLKGIVKLSPPLSKKPFYHYLHKKNIHLLPEITAVLQDMENEGVIKHYRDKVMSDLALP